MGNIFLPSAMIMSPGFWSAAQALIHLTAIVIDLLPAEIRGPA